MYTVIHYLHKIEKVQRLSFDKILITVFFLIKLRFDLKFSSFIKSTLIVSIDIAHNTGDDLVRLRLLTDKLQ